MGADRNQWQFPKNEVGKVIGWSDEASPSNPSASKGLVNKGPFATPADLDTKQDASPNLTTLAAVNPGAAGLLALAGITVENFFDAVAADFSGGHSGAQTYGIPAFLRSLIVDVASYCDSDDDVDCHADVQAAFDDGEGKIIIFRPRRYKSGARPSGLGATTNAWRMPKRAIIIFMEGAYLDCSEWANSGNAKYLLYAQGTISSPFSLNASASNGDDTITLADATDFPDSGHGIIVSNAIFTAGEGISIASKGEWFRAAGKSTNTLSLNGGLRDDYSVSDLETGTAQTDPSATDFSIMLAADAATAVPGRVIELTGGTGAGQTRTVSTYDGSTKVLTVTQAWDTNPDNTTTYAFPMDARVYEVTEPVTLKIYGLDIRGCGQFATDTVGDRGVWIEYGVDCEVNGRISRSDQMSLLFNVCRDCKANVTVEFDPKGTNTVNQYGPHVANLCENIEIIARVYGGKEGSGSTSTGGIAGGLIGPSRNCRWHDGFYTGQWRMAHTQHDIAIGFEFTDNIVDACGGGVETRVVGGLISRNRFSRLGFFASVPDAAVYLGSGASSVTVEANKVIGAGYLVWRSSIIEDETVTGTVGNIYVRGNFARGLTDGGVIIERHADDDEFTLGTIEVSNNDIEVDSSVPIAIDVEGNWDNPTIKANTLRGGSGGSACIFLHNTSAGAGFGPVSPTVVDNIYDNFVEPVIQHDTGAPVTENNRKIGRKSTGLSYSGGFGAASTTHTGDTNETVLRTITVPKAHMGPNGWIEIDVTWGTPGGSANAKTGRVRYNGDAGTTYYSVSVTTALSLRAHVVIQNRNSTSSQVGGAATALAGGYGSSTSAVPTSTINSDDARDIVITGLLANAADSIRCERVDVKVFYAP